MAPGGSHGYNTAAYFWNEGGPGSIQKHIADIQASGLTTVILIALHVGRKMPEYPDMKIGDLIYNDYPQNLLVTGGKFNPNNSPAIAAWPAQVAQLKQQGSVSKVFISVGGDERYRCRTSGPSKTCSRHSMAGTLKENIAELKAAFTINGVCAIDGFDIDCEEGGCAPEHRRTVLPDPVSAGLRGDVLPLHERRLVAGLHADLVESGDESELVEPAMLFGRPLQP